MFNSRSIRAVAASAIVFGFITTLAGAQWVIGIEHPFVSGVGQRDLDRLIELFEPDPQMELVIRQVFDDHREGFRAFVTESKPLYDRRMDIAYEFDEEKEEFVIPNVGERSLMVEKAMLPLAEKQAALDRRVIEGWRGLLSESDPNLWEQFERERRLRLARGIMWGPARADLATIVDQLELGDEERGEIDPFLHLYALDRDAAVGVHLQVATESYRTRWKRMEATLEMQNEAEAAKEAAKQQGVDDAWDLVEIANEIHGRFRRREYQQNWRQQEPSRRLRQINLNYANVIAEAIEEFSEEKAIEFRDLVRLAMYPEAFRQQPAAGYLERVLALDLDDDIRERVDAVAQSYFHEDAQLSENVVRAQDKRFADRLHSPHRSPPAEMENQARENDATDARADLSDKTVDIIFRLLTIPQQEAAPKPRHAARASRP